MFPPGSADPGVPRYSQSMLSAYSWSQFGLFILALVLLYYLVVGLLYYRQELTDLLSSRRKPGSRALAADAAGVVAPPALVRPTSAFAPAGEFATVDADAETESPAAGAAENLPTASEPVVGGELPASTAAATGQDESTDETTLPQAAHSSQAEAQVQDEARTEETDQADERLAALVRREVPSQSVEEELQPIGPALEPETIPADLAMSGYEPLATFDEPVASLLDIITAEPASQLVAADSVSEYIALLQAGQNPPMPAALQGSCLAAQMAQHLDHFNAELNALLEMDEV